MSRIQDDGDNGLGGEAHELRHNPHPTPTSAPNGINISTNKNINISVNYSVNNSVNNLVTTSKDDPLGEWLVKSGDTEILEVAKHRDT